MAILNLKAFPYRCKLLFSIGILLLIQFATNAQDIKYKVQHFTTEDGLSQNFIESIFQDSYGFIWIGTDDGLNIYDGYKFQTFKADDNLKSSISGNHIYAVKEDKFKNIWIATDNGLDKYTYKSDKFVHYLNDPKSHTSLSSNDLRDIFVDDQQNIWIATNGGGLEMLPANEVNSPTPRFTHFKYQNNSNNCIVSDFLTILAEDSHGNLWIGTSNGLSCYHRDSKKFDTYKGSGFPGALTSNLVYCLYKDKKNRIWVGTDFGLCVFNELTKQFKRYEADPNRSDKLHHAIVYAIKEDQNGRMMVGGLGGLHFFDELHDSFDRMPVKINDENSLSNEYINSLLCDKTGIIWVGTERGGLNRFNPLQKKFNYYSMDTINHKSLDHNIINSIYDEKDYLWVGTSGGGLNILDKKTQRFNYYKNNPKDPNSLSLNYISAIAAAGNGEVWVGTWGAGINIMGANNPHKVLKKLLPDPKDPYSLGYVFIADIRFDNRGLAWISAGSVYVSDPKTKKCYDFSNINGNKILGISCTLPTKDGNIWVASGEGVFLIETPKAYTSIEDLIKKSKVYAYKYDPKNKNTIKGHHITSISKGSKGDIWFGTRGFGINHLKSINAKTHEAIFENFTKKDGLPNNMVYGLMEDEANKVWITTDKGLSSYNYRTKKFKNYYTIDGLQSNQFFWGAYAKSADGSMYVGGINGINYFKPDEIKDNPNIPSTYIVDFKIYNKSILLDSTYWDKKSSNLTETKEITLNYKEAIFSIEFAGLSYDQPQKNRYAYKLDGIDKDWVYVDADRRFASYTNLSAGNYLFEVKASNNDGLWNNQATTLKINILPPWWATWWFRSFLIIFIGGGTVAFYAYRLYAARRLNKILEEKVQIRTKELKAANTQLIEHQEEITQQAEELKTINDELGHEKQKVEHSFKNYQVLSEFGQKITTQLETESLNLMVYQYVKSLMPADAFGIGLYSAKKQSIDYYNFLDNNKIIKLISVPLNKANDLTAYCANEKKAIFIEDLDLDYLKYIAEKPEIQLQKRPSSLIMLPLVYDNLLIGVISISSLELHAYSEVDLNIMQTLSSYLSIALSNSHSFELLKIQNQNIKSSIHYAQNIQQAILPDKKNIDQFFESFIIYQPKDVVSGDFYWFSEIEGKLIFAVVDCTGHGVPGAFMSLIGSQLLSKIVNEKKIFDPALIIEGLNIEIINSLRQDDSNNNDGMDLSICVLERKGSEYELTFAGAKNTILVFDHAAQSIEKMKPDSHSLGGKSLIGKNYRFNNQRKTLSSKDMIYMYTDGIIDLNDKDRKRYGSKKLISVIETNSKETMERQKQAVIQSMIDHNSDNDQRDDITIVGLRLQ